MKSQLDLKLFGIGVRPEYGLTTIYLNIFLVLSY